MDKIVLRGIEFYAHGGVTAAEREVGQRYRVNVELCLDLSRAAQSDDLADTVSYARVHDLIIETACAHPFHLLESVTGRIVHRLLEEFSVDQVTVQLQKLLPPLGGVVEYAGVEMTRRADGVKPS